VSGSPAHDAAWRAAVQALQAAMAAENAAVFGYGVAGAHLTGAKRAAAQRDWVAHESGRDALAAQLAARGGSLVPAATAYKLPFAVRNPIAAAALAAYLEDRVAAAYLGLVALTDAGLRSLGARGVRAAALRAAAWRDRTLAFPGFQVLAPRNVPTSQAPYPTSVPPPAPTTPAVQAPPTTAASASHTPAPSATPTSPGPTATPGP
jgi:Domain of unknown function (DUF4439)